MHNIRKIITERLDNAREEFRYLQRNSDGSDDYKLSEIIGQMEAYHDCLTLMQPRTEQEILNDFEKLGWKVTQNDDGFIILCFNSFARIVILKQFKNYHINGVANMQEHKLLNELFICWGWV